MAGELVYLDASALVKIILFERETDALREFLRTRPERVTSIVSAAEISRAIRRGTSQKADRRRAEDLLEGIGLLPLDEKVARTAGNLDPLALPSLDAIHLATALSLGRDLGAFVAYDTRLLEAARRLRLPVATPR